MGFCNPKCRVRAPGCPTGLRWRGRDPEAGTVRHLGCAHLCDEPGRAALGAGLTASTLKEALWDGRAPSQPRSCVPGCLPAGRAEAARGSALLLRWPRRPDSASSRRLQAGRVRPRGAEPPAAHPPLFLGGRNASGILPTFSYITLGT